MKKWIVIAGLVCVAGSIQAASGDQTKDQYVAKEKAKWTQKGWRWDQAKVEANFVEVDVNKDGIASGKERQNWFAKKKAEKNK